MRRRTIPFALLIAAACALSPVPVLAAAGQPIGVMDRPRPDYDAKGLPVGGFRLRPALDVGAAYDDNVYRTSGGKQGDVFYSIHPSFSLRSEWSRHMVELTGSLTRYQYNSRTSENRMDWDVGGNGRFDFGRNLALEGGASYSTLHEQRYSPDEPGNAAEPTQYNILRAGSTLRYRPNRFGLELGGSYDRFTYDPTRLIGGGIANNRDRNRDQYRATAKASYEFAPGYALFLRGSYDDRQYATTAGAGRDSHGYRADLGGQMFLTHLLQGEVFVGFAHQDFRAFRGVDAVNYGAKLHWFATPLLTVHLTASRLFNDTTIGGASITDDQSAALALDYELLRNLILQAHVKFTDSRFVGTSRDDKLFESGLTAKYLINRYMSANAGYAWQRRSSSAAGQGFTDNLFQAGLHFQL